MERKAVLIGGLGAEGIKGLLDLELAKVSESSDKVRTLVIVDNFEDSRFDDDIVSKLDIHVEMVGGGCFCCQLKEDFRALLEEEKRDFDPSAIFVELPIMADAESIRSIMKDAIHPNLEFVTVFVIDCENADVFFEAFPDLMERNLQQAGLIVLASKEKTSSLPASLKNAMQGWALSSCDRMLSRNGLRIFSFYKDKTR